MSETNGNRAEYTECFAAYVDLLGFGALVKRSKKDPEMTAILIKALNRIGLDTPCSIHERVRRDANGRILDHDTCGLQVRPFSDCVCLFLPTRTGGLPSLLSSVRYIHDRMLELGICIRGAMTIGSMYWDPSWCGDTRKAQNQPPEPLASDTGQDQPAEPIDQGNSSVLYQAGMTGFPITLGPALVEAYELERDVAVYPRVVASDKLQSWLSEHRDDSAFPLSPPNGGQLRDFFRTGDDAVPFLDLLHPGCRRDDTQRIVRTREADGRYVARWESGRHTHDDVIENTTSVAREALNECRCPEKIRVKYKWLQSYVNEVKREHRSS
jgi:hypothetical protein